METVTDTDLYPSEWEVIVRALRHYMRHEEELIEKDQPAFRFEHVCESRKAKDTLQHLLPKRIHAGFD